MRGVGGWRHDAQSVPLARSSLRYAGIGYQNCFSTPSLGQEAALAGLASNRAEPLQNTPRDGQVSQPQSRVSKMQDTAWWQGCGLCIICHGLAVPLLRAASLEGSNREVVEVFPLGGMGGCFYITLPHGEVQCPSYRKCKPYIGSLAEQTHLYVIHTARQRKWRSTC